MAPAAAEGVDDLIVNAAVVRAAGLGASLSIGAGSTLLEQLCDRNQSKMSLRKSVISLGPEFWRCSNGRLRICTNSSLSDLLRCSCPSSAVLSAVDFGVD